MLLDRLLKQDWGPSILLGILGVLCVFVPVANLLVPEDSMFHVSTYTVTLLGKYLCYALLAMALD
ncbi:MAG: urea ABC transporter permease subunit UrtC, partial [Pseudomonadales bacterium]|nr:urea ABC transporter permease subunit UrtC [Pseudomonadales bacterium]